MPLVLPIIGVDEASQKLWIDLLIRSLQHYYYLLLLSNPP